MTVYSDGKNRAYSGQGQFASNIAAFAVMFVLFIASLYVLSFWTLENAWWPGITCLVLATAAFLIPQQIMGRSDIKVEREQR
ncbi:hypothetical protein [Zhihengliuella flava]|uniref:Quinol-cytochrome oxidoreductase complex cytochrome b subunit n=1 Tax=Zhihengliuella flava TaxID=1285193 RepID=A0A931D8E5_9MICC|nr:hypothetical protein [Zhihengliuella flava]MBG6083937.1 quinol-cytochrome oxidoreductase complex cytochrome b subunit [Zhihengliuella flava]